MTNKSGGLLQYRLFAMALLALLFVPGFCLALTDDPVHSSGDRPAPPTADSPPATGSTATRDGTEAGDSATPQPPPQSGSQKGGLSGFASRVKNFDRNGPRRDHWSTINLGTKYVNAVLEGFDQGAVLGFGIQATTADLIPYVEFRATAITSPNFFRRVEGEAYIPRVFDTKTHADIWFDYIRRTKDNFFGIGPRIPNTSQTNVDLEQRIYAGLVAHDFTDRVQVGGYVSVSNASTYRGQRDSDIPIDVLFSGDPNVVPVTKWAPGLLSNAKIVWYGGFALYDARDHSHGLTKGAYFYGRMGSADGLDNKNAFSDYGWLEGEIDGRGYLPLGSDKTSLAVRVYANLKDPKGGSQIPFYNQSFLGGRNYVRGYKNFRYRGDSLLMGSVELRQTVWAQKEDRGLDVFGFGDAGQVWGDNRSQTDPAVLANKDFSSSNWRAGIGGGFQYRYSKAFAGRIDVGHSHERTLIYFSISRGF
ncbi:MAG TPA: BamA/TamA family outer membrane protein [Blastocatellia bacterium]|nr:BamA/TamA family outer membrane protein [Blastocatellia bacterium]